MIGSSFINIDDGKVSVHMVRMHGKGPSLPPKKKKKATFYAVLSYINGTN
jgi:hypothetical protein